MEQCPQYPQLVVNVEVVAVAALIAPVMRAECLVDDVVAAQRVVALFAKHNLKLI
jgi:hypothetical protein